MGYRVLWSWPDWDRAGWHVDLAWDWLTFGIVLCVTWGESVAIRVGWASVVVWRSEKSGQ